MHVINPLKTNNELSIQTQSVKESASVPSSEGLMMSLDTSLIYHLNPDRASDVFQKTGADYEDKLVEPMLRAAIREATASHTANALYTGEREMVAQEALALNFRLQKQTQDPQRKRIEAQGIRDFQQIVAQGISPQLLEWKGIEATELLAKSSNSKVVVIGNSKNGLPLILGQ